MNYLIVMPKNSAKSSGGYNVFPVGIAYVASSLKQCTDNVYTSNLEFHEKCTYEALKELILENNIDVVCTGGLSRDYQKVKEIIDTSKKINEKIITVIGGGIISGDPVPSMIALEADIGVIGQGEITICELADALDNGKELNNVAGLIYKNDKGEFVQTQPRSDVDNIDLIPFPDYDGFSFAEYMESINNEVTYVIGSRSCPFSCTFCFHPSGKKYRTRSLDNLFKEIDYLINTFDVDNLVVSDELFAPNRKRVIKFCERIKPYNIVWSVQLRVNDVDAELLEIMRDAGCNGISFGIESADDTVLKSMKKRITVKQIEHALSITHNADIDIQGGLIFGDTAETKETYQNSLNWHAKHLEYGLELNMINIFPGTPLYYEACSRGVIKDKVEFLTSGCPLINVSKLTDEEYVELASIVYEKNMRAKYLPEKYSIKEFKDDGKCSIEMICNKCGAKTIVETDLLHIQKTHCSECMQRYYVDPFQKIEHSPKLIEPQSDKTIAIWGAGEICIKLLEEYPIFHTDNFKIVDISKSRQGYFVSGKKIFSTDEINKEDISTVIIAVVHRKNEVFEELKQNFPSVSKVYIPSVKVENNKATFVFKEFRANELDIQLAGISMSI